LKPSRRFIAVVILIAGISFLIGALGTSQMPKIRSFVMLKIETVSRENLPVRILPGSVDVSFFPLGITLRNVNVIAKEEVTKFLESAWFRHVSMTISPWQLFRGKLRLNTLEIDGARVNATLPASTKKGVGPPLNGLFSIIGQVPINLIVLEDIGGHLTLNDPKLSLELNNINLTVEKRKGSALSVNLTSASIRVFNAGKDPASTLSAEIETAAVISRSRVEIESFHVRRGDTFVSSTAELQGDLEALEFQDAKVELKTDINLESIAKWAARTFPRYLRDLPDFKGRSKIEASLKRHGGKAIAAEVRLEANGLKIDKYLVDKLKTHATYQENGKVPEIKMAHLEIDNPAGLLDLENVVISLGEEKTISGVVNTQNLQLHQLLLSLDVGAVPVFLQISGGLPCSASIKEDFKVSCAGKLTGDNLLVRDSMTSKGSIVALRTFVAEGEVHVDKKKVSYAADLLMPDSAGKSNGSIHYDQGFKIAYEGDRVAFKDIANLADLKLEGTAQIKGVTEGDSDAATLNLDIDGKDFWLDDFWLGNAKSQIAYKAGMLTFSNMQGFYSVSRYSGDLKLDLKKKELNITGRSPFFDMRDMLKVFSRKVNLPFTTTGTGQAQIRASGPLSLGQLTYDLRTSVFRGAVAGETFEQFNFDVKSNAGEVKAERVQLSKGTSLITLTGLAHPDGTIKALVQGRGLKIEDSNFVSTSGLALSGNVDFDMDLGGAILSPDNDFRAHLSRTSIGDQSMTDSTVHMVIGSKSLRGDGHLIGESVKAEFSIPFTPTSPFSLKLSSTDWNYAPLFAAIAGPVGRKDYEGRLTMNVDLTSQTGGFWNSTGQIQIEKLALSRGTLALKLQSPSALTLKSGQFFVDKIELNGDNGNFLKITENPKPVAKLDFQVNGKLDMSLFGLFTPFLEDLRGLVSFAFNLRGSPGKSDLLGSAYIEKGYVKLFDFVHPFEDLRADLLFSQSKILLNTIKAEFASGRLTGSGGIELKGNKNYPVNITGLFDKVSMNVPEKVRTQGSGSATFTGSWFPFLLKINYEVSEGLWTKEFGGGDQDDTESVRRDQFLPELLLQERFTPVILDLNINFNKGIQVKNELVESKVSGIIAVKGPPTKPSILGTVSMEKDSKIIVKDTIFEVKTGNIELDDPQIVNPKLYIVARSRIQEYDVNLLVQGTGSKPDLTFTSVPPLSNRDIISLLALGTTETAQATPSALAIGAPGSQASGPNVAYGSGPLRNNPLTKEIKEKTGFELQFAPSFDEQSAGQKIIIKRQFSNKFGVAASQAIGSHRTTDAEARYRLNDRVSGILSWQNSDQLDSWTGSASKKEQNQFGLDLEYKFEFK
jgi:translocation and assembly module TamB